MSVGYKYASALHLVQSMTYHGVVTKHSMTALWNIASKESPCGPLVHFHLLLVNGVERAETFLGGGRRRELDSYGFQSAYQIPR